MKYTITKKQKTVSYSRFLIALMLLLCSTSIKAQYYFHDDNILQQFTFMEDGGGMLSPRWYYNFFHKRYQQDPLLMGGKNGKRFLFNRSLLLDNEIAVRVDSLNRQQAKSEAMNVVSRNKDLDLSKNVELKRIDAALDNFNRNINRIPMYGGSHESHKVWQQILQCFIQARNETENAYMDSGSRKKEYLKIYNDVIKHNVDVTNYLRVLAGAKNVEQFIKGKQTYGAMRTHITVAYDAFNRWRTSASVIGFSSRRNNQ